MSSSVPRCGEAARRRSPWTRRLPATTAAESVRIGNSGSIGVTGRTIDRRRSCHADSPDLPRQPRDHAGRSRAWSRPCSRYLGGERFGNPSSRLHALRPGGRGSRRRGARDGRDGDRRRAARRSSSRAARPSRTGSRSRRRLPRRPRPHVVASAIEHKSVLDAAAGRLTTVRPGRTASSIPPRSEEALTPGTVSSRSMAANNEIGTIQPIAEIARACRRGRRAIPLRRDAPRSAASRSTSGPSASTSLSFSAHKIYGPKGVGVALRATRARAPVARPGTRTCRASSGSRRRSRSASQERDAEAAAPRELRNRLLAALSAGLDVVAVNGDLERRLDRQPERRVSPGVDGRALVIAAARPRRLVGIGVLERVGRAEPRAPRDRTVPRGGARVVRFGIGRFNTEEEIDRRRIVIASESSARDSFRSAGLESDRVLGSDIHADRQ